MMNFAIFFTEYFLLTVFRIFPPTPYPFQIFHLTHFEKTDFLIYLNIVISIFDLECIYARSNIWNFYYIFILIKIEKLESVFYVFGRFFDYFFYRPKFQKWNLIKNPWYTKIQHCTTLIFIKKLEFCDFF